MMKQIFSALLVLCLSGAGFVHAQTSPLIVPAPPMVAASSYIMIDAFSGRVLVEHNADERLPPASLTKMMTAYIAETELAAGRLQLTDQVRISEKAWRTGGSKTFVLVDTDVAVEDLMRGIVIQSGNDASIALAEHLAGSEDNFATVMNQYAQRMGLSNTNFVNATGLPANNHYSTARDMAILATHKALDHPQYYQWYSEREFTFSGITQPNRNTLLWQNPSVDGLKTGHTEEAGYCLVASAVEEGMRLITVVMGTSSNAARIQETQKLLSYGFRYFESSKVQDAATSLHAGRIWGGEVDEVALGIAEDLYVTVPKGSANSVRTVLEVDSQLEAPVRTGQVLGELRVLQGEEVLAVRELIALQDVERGGFFKRIWDYITLFFIGIFS
ncbi:D-alanyl-D-alanine carboxypeptidase family protein [Salinispirillum marinum]|uniref:serine-type D-Ala-D-Ala carboxypeptidase n=2 Tax=Saccharospirillaceae TaxID=255527 RepID=A0ABV8BAJ8_9GAMM